jgi:hypothetical protein
MMNATSKTNESRPSADNVIALPQGMAGASTGAVVWWELTGNVNHAKLVEAWEEQGLDKELLPDLPSAKVALTRAVDDVVRENAARKKHRVSDANWLVFDVKPSQEKNKKAEFIEVFDASLNKDKSAPVVTLRDDADPTLSKQIRDRFFVHQSRLEATDIGTWLSTKMLGKVDAVSLRNRGGIYFVHKEQVETFSKIKAALTKVSTHLVFKMDALKSDEAVEAILHAITSEAKQQADDIENVLDKGGVGPRAYKTQRKHAEEMIKKVEVYENLLDKKLDDLRERLADLAASSMEAAMAAEAEASKAQEEAKANK